MLVRSRYILTFPDQPLVCSGGVRIEQGEIRELLSEEYFETCEEPVHDLGNSVLMPGLCLTHTHVDYGLFRGQGDGLGFLPWIQSLMARKAQVGGALSQEFFLAGARLSCLELVAAGVTSVGEATDPGTSALQALGEAGLKAVCFQEEFGPDPKDAKATMKRLRGKWQLLEEKSHEFGGRIHVGVSPHAPYTLSEALFDAMVQWARETKSPMSIHLAETAEEVAFVQDGTGPLADSHRRRDIPVTARGCSPYEYLRKNGWLDGPEAIHLVHGVKLGVEDLQDFGTRPSLFMSHCPRSNARLGEGVAPVREALNCGVKVTLGSDGICSADRLDPWEEMRAALWLSRGVREEAESLGATEILGACLAGHASLGFGGGSIAVGSPADLCAVSLDGISMTPFEGTAAALVRQASASDVCFTMVAGEVLYQRGEFRRVDAAKILSTARRLAEPLV